MTNQRIDLWAIKKILLGVKKKNGFDIIMGVVIWIVGIYFSTTLWYLILRLGVLQTLKIDSAVFIYVLLMLCCILFSMFRIPDILYFNKNIEYLFCYPITSKLIITPVVSHYCLKQFIISFLLFIPMVLLKVPSKYHLLGCFIAICISELIIIRAALLISLITILLSGKKWAGYLLMLEQYAPIAVVAVIINQITLHSDQLYLIKLVEFACSGKGLFYLTVILLTIIQVYLYLYRNKYETAYFKVNGYKISINKIYKSAHKIKHAYLFLEVRQIMRNKTLLFNAFFKTGIVVLILFKVIIGRFDRINEEMLYIILACLIAALNNISVTAYSRDWEDVKMYHILPIKLNRVFYSKVFISFIINQLLIAVYLLYIMFFQSTDTMQLFLYATSMNFLCSFLGVLLDYQSPSKKSSINEMVHGNLNRIIVLIITLIKLGTDLTIIRFFDLSTLHIVNICAILILTIYSQKILKIKRSDL